MSRRAAVQHHVVLTHGPETATVIAEVPALQIADSGVDGPEALDRLQAMATLS
jgi:hypothetical protein